jgi:2-iminoacetate synthase ThiH
MKLVFIRFSVSRNLSSRCLQIPHKGKKSNFDFRLDTPDRVGTAGIHKIGLGVYWIRRLCTDSFFNALHLDYLQKRIGKLNMRFLSPDCDRQKELA